MLKRKRGFTLFEMMVVLSIISIMAILVLVRFREGEKQYALDQAAQRLAVDLREAQGRAVSGADPGFAIAGYGIFINSANSYSLFLGTDKDSNNCPIADSYSTIKTVNLTNTISIDNVGSRIFFVPPRPTTCINGSPSEELVVFSLTRPGSSVLKQVKVTKYGNIQVQ